MKSEICEENFFWVYNLLCKIKAAVQRNVISCTYSDVVNLSFLHQTPVSLNIKMFFFIVAVCCRQVCDKRSKHKDKSLQTESEVKSHRIKHLITRVFLTGCLQWCRPHMFQWVLRSVHNNEHPRELQPLSAWESPQSGLYRYSRRTWPPDVAPGSSTESRDINTITIFTQRST